MKKLRVSVRNLVEHSLRSGDLVSSWEPSSPLEGSRIHRLIQRTRKGDYRSEVQVSHTVESRGFELLVQGRIDGVFTIDGRVLIEEIKTTVQDLESFAEQDPLHWGQAKLYASIFAQQNGLDRIDVQLTYCHRITNQTRQWRESFTSQDLARFFDETVDCYLSWQAALREWRALRNEGLHSGKFPFGFRPGQRQMAVAVYRAMADGRRLLIQAPTGVGKTMAVVFPALKAIAKDAIDSLFFVAARTTGKGVAESTLETLGQTGMRVKSVTLTAREKICFNPGKACNGDECEYARGYYDRLEGARKELFEHDAFTRPVVEDTARRHTVCPFALSVEMARWAECVISDYHYVLSATPFVEPLGLEERGGCALAVDEAHNLVDRSREMYSAQISRGAFEKLRKLLKKERAALTRSVGGVVRALGGQKKRRLDFGDSFSEKEPPQSLTRPLQKFVGEAEAWLMQPGRDSELRDALLESYFDTLTFLRVLEDYDDRYVTCFEASGRNIAVKLFCLDPSNGLGKALSRFKATVFFSATLSPGKYFQKALGCGPLAIRLRLPSPFPPGNLCVLISDRVSTLYRRRAETRHRIARMLASFVSSRRGHYLLFFPSYEYMRMVLEPYSEMAEAGTLLIQEPAMSEEARDGFLRRFSNPAEDSLVGFAVMGGVFSEGIDLVGERLTGAAIVGVGLPGISLEREEIRGYFSEQGASGFDYAYRFPGNQRILQAAGRVIRSETDRGAVLLIDERFSSPAYRRLLPAEWAPLRVRDENDLSMALSRFWNRN